MNARVVGWVTLAIATGGLVLTGSRFKADVVPEAFERAIRVSWVVWLGVALLGVVTSVRTLQLREEARKLQALFALVGLVATGGCVILLRVVGGRLATPELVWACVLVAWSITLLVLARQPGKIK
jgi:hypothetical membrane protein